MAQGYYYDGTPIGGASVNSNAPQNTYDKWVGAQTNTNSKFDPNNYQTDASGARFTPGYSAPVTTNALANANSLGTTPVNNGGSNPAANGGFSGGTTGVSYPSGNSYSPQSTSSIQDQINQLKDAQISAAVAALGKSRDASLSNLSAEKSTIEPQYYASRNAASTSNQLQAKNFAEYMAQRGQTNSGVSNQGAIASNVSLQGGLNSLNTQEMASNADNARRVTDVGNAYQSDLVTAKSGAESQALQNLINQMNTDRTFNAGQAQLAQAQSNWNTTNAQTNAQNIFDNNLNTRKTDASIADSTVSTAVKQAQLLEIQNPNSVTNQLQKLNLDTANLNFSALPDKLKAEAQQIAQSLQLGQINLTTAQQKLDFLPQQLQADLNATNRSNISSGTKVPAGTKGADGGKYSDSSTASLKSKMDDALANGAPIGDLLSELDGMVQDGTTDLKNVDVPYLQNYLKGKIQSIGDLRRSQGGGI